MTMTSLLWHHLYLERSQSVQYFAQQFSFATRKCWTASNEKSEQVQQANVFKLQTLMFHFFIFQRIVQIHVNIYLITRRFDCMRESTAAIVALVVETTIIFHISTTLSRPRTNFLHQTYIAGLVKYLSPYTGRISDWKKAFALSPFAHSKRITEGCSLRDNFNGNVAVSNVYKWRHSERHRNKTHTSYWELNPLQNVYVRIFIVWKLTEWRRFVTYLWNDPRSKIYTPHVYSKLHMEWSRRNVANTLSTENTRVIERPYTEESMLIC